MNQNLIDKYVTLDNINKIANKEGIILENYEINYIYNEIKNNWQKICYGDTSIIFNNLKNNVKNDTYQCILKLYNKYKLFLN